MKFDQEIQLLLSAVDKIPPEYWSKTNSEHGRHEVCWFMDRQKPSVERSWDFDEERFGITKEGKIIWGFDSGCSCPVPWEDANDPYQVSEWKEFVVAPEKAFDADWEDVCYDRMKEILGNMLNV